MAPILIEAPAGQLDLAKDSLKAIVVIFVYLTLAHGYLFNEKLTMRRLLMTAAFMVAGLAVYYIVVPNFLRIVVKDGDERYYHTLQKYQS